MVTFFIVAAVMLLLFAKDFPPLLRDGDKKVITFYSVATGAALIVIALYCFSGALPALFGA